MKFRHMLERWLRVATVSALLVGSHGAVAAIVTEFAIAGAPTGLTSGPDGNVWFTQSGLNRIGRMTPAGVVTYFTAGLAPGSNPTRITAGPDGNLWFAQINGFQVGRITPSGVITQFDVSGSTNSVSAGPDGNVWFTQNAARRVGGWRQSSWPVDDNYLGR